MKIAMISTDYLPNIGGIAAHIFNLSLAMQELGEKVVVINPLEADSDYFRREVIQEVVVYKLGINRHSKWFRNKMIRKRMFSRAVAKAMKKIEAECGGFDIIHQHDYQDTTYACQKLQTSKRKWIWTNHSSRFLRDYPRRLKMKYIARTYRAASKIITVSEELYAKTQEILPDSPIGYIPNGVNDSRFNPAVTVDRSQYQINTNDFVVLCPRRMARKNGVIYLAKAVAEVIERNPEILWKFVFVGSEPTINTHSDYIQEIRNILQPQVDSGQVLLLGNIPMEDMPKINALADIVMMPSLMEAVSLSALEGMATKKVLLTTNVGGLPEIIKHEQTGLLVLPEDHKAIADALIRLGNDQALRATVAEGGYVLATEQYSWRSVAQRTLDLYRSA